MKLLVKAMAGSHLFGTNTPDSDKDYKGIFLPSARDILLCKNIEGISSTTGNNESKNSKDDVDTELYSFKKFVKMAKNGDTSALELLFTPDELILEKDPLWDYIVSQRHIFLSSKISGIIGYCRQQANKYGIKGSRMGELSNIIEFLKNKEKELGFPNPKLKHSWSDILEEIKKYDHVRFVELDSKGAMIPAIDILGKKFSDHTPFPYVLDILKKVYKNYGQRAREAKKNNGIDWKALSHAVRVMYQGIELLSSGTITLPLPKSIKTQVLKIKKGEMEYKDVQQLIEDLTIEVEEEKRQSKLPEKLNDIKLEELIIKLHREQFNGRI